MRLLLPGLVQYLIVSVLLGIDRLSVSVGSLWWSWDFYFEGAGHLKFYLQKLKNMQNGGG